MAVARSSPTPLLLYPTGGGRSGLGSIDTVTAEVARIQTNIQSMLQQLNTLAMAVNGLTRTLGSVSCEGVCCVGCDYNL